MMYDDYGRRGSTRDQIDDLVRECVRTNNEIIIVELILQLEKDYIDIARLATMDEYRPDWTHEEVLTYMTYNT